MKEKGKIFEEDSRYHQCNREMWVTVLFFVINILIMGGLSVLIGYNVPGEEVKLIAGFPDWFFYGAIVGWVVLCFVVYFMVKFFYKDMSLNKEE
ncbi:protein of unknown function DUF997 [Caldalkalibacillus thermarum TA2.A1]|uniref:YhdT family protein n=1 Tax=Caldalkalibacillus thermarum (strain TA2.A1) TaxID=986075 RepID=F5L494_CALTT|nr:YhdT family protein [Caldalkalibacillus thermarum]EGL83835.1 protein of unknown function DUF997 [Caldalkalibacillus thermarum TA2.A1]QZT32489.1 YhdT family protein [Caldalkalibacillus thermarum TA2.A1]